MSLTIREPNPSDEAFLYELYCSTRIDEIAGLGWGAAQQQAFFKLQFAAQRQHYALAYQNAEHGIVLVDGRPVGRILVFRTDKEFVLVDIALLPDHRGSGIGTALIQGLLDQATQSGAQVVLHVDKQNRARRLYQRLGFETIGDDGVYFKMKWSPAPVEMERARNA